VPVLTYLDFDLLIERSGKGYRARVLSSPSGEASREFLLPFTREQLEIFVLRAIGLGSRRRVRRIESPEMREIKGFGRELFEAVFDDEVNTCLRRSLDEADRRRAGLRIRLRLDDTDGEPAVKLFDVPWEFMYDPGGIGFLCLSRASPLVRYPDLPRPIQPLAVAPPLRLLVMISSPRDAPRLDVEHEGAKLEQALQTPIENGLITIDRLENPTLEQLQRRLRTSEYHVFHFIGHGGYDERSEEGVLLLENDEGRGDPVSAQFLRTLFQNHRSLRLAVLNACEGARTDPTDPFAGVAQSLVQGGVSAVIAMQFEISDEAAITLSSEFYSALADGYPVDAALAEARTAVYTRVNTVEWAVPVLYLRSPDGSIFDVATPPPAERPHPPAPPEKEEAPAAPATDRTRSPVVVAAASSGQGGPGPGARRKRRRWVVAVLVALAAAALFVAGIQVLGGNHEVETASTAPGPNAVIPFASFEKDTEEWGPQPRTTATGSTRRASDFATHGSFSLQIDSTKPGWFGREFGAPIDISGKSVIRVDIKTVSGDRRTAIAVQLGESPWTWCQSPDNLDANGAVTLDLMKCKRGRPSDLTELQAVWLYLNEGSFRVDNVRAE